MLENEEKKEVLEANDAVLEVNDTKKKKRASAWFMGEATLFVTAPDDGNGDYKKQFANKDLAEEWVLNNLQAGEKAEISVVYKSFQSKEVVVNEIVED